MHFRSIAVVLAIALSIFLTGAPVQSAWPGQNGRLIFSRDSGLKYTDLWTANPNGSDPQQLTDGSNFEWEASQSPANGQIVFTEFKDDTLSYEICLLDKFGDCDRLTTTAPWDRFADFSPDGQKIIWEREEEIYKMNADGSSPRRVVDLPGAELGPVWKPDGSLIAFLRYRNLRYDIFVMKPNGDNVRRVTDTEKDESYPEWHPTRDVLVYPRQAGENNANIFKTSIERGSRPTKLTSARRNELEAAFSPNGRRIVYTRFHPETSYDIWMMKSNGADEHPVIATNDRDFNPYWLVD